LTNAKNCSITHDAIPSWCASRTFFPD
jgi:hypothetical protein